MRFGIGLIGLLVALAIVAVLAKKQVAATRVSVPVQQSAPVDGASAPKNAREQSQQIQEQFKQQLDSAMQQQQERIDKEAP
ncbi:hypothetical protein [Diaphorobacter aerolatus]|uniref:Uncharacterized protein n=1 Tax=Diaphorobacter aerolatus TaxID=1288495 RepID=A0A7H0GKD2_9BURK|nr:hypothetical protein [Diaphorobacter aerolatus]QNP48748.1 hypothetical protein H9K75_00355 [Diaphorobacter aerolatus]